MSEQLEGIWLLMTSTYFICSMVSKRSSLIPAASNIPQINLKFQCSISDSYLPELISASTFQITPAKSGSRGDLSEVSHGTRSGPRRKRSWVQRVPAAYFHWVGLGERPRLRSSPPAPHFCSLPPLTGQQRLRGERRAWPWVRTGWSCDWLSDTRWERRWKNNNNNNTSTLFHVLMTCHPWRNTPTDELRLSFVLQLPPILLFHAGFHRSDDEITEEDWYEEVPL